MWFRLAALWGCPLREAKARITEAEFTQWIAFYSLEPWGCEAEDERAGKIAAMVHNSAGRVATRLLEWRDCFQRAAVSSREQSPEDIRAMWLNVLKLEQGCNK